MRNQRRALIGVVTFIVVLYVVFRLLAFPAGLFSATFVGGFVIWMLTTYRVPVDPQVMVVPHLVTVMLFIAHVYEEFVTHIEVVMTRLTGVQVSQGIFLAIAAFLAPIIWIAGLLMVVGEQPLTSADRHGMRPHVHAVDQLFPK